MRYQETTVSYRKINSAKELREKKLAAECKDNPKAFGGYVQSEKRWGKTFVS